MALKVTNIARSRFIANADKYAADLQRILDTYWYTRENKHGFAKIAPFTAAEIQTLAGGYDEELLAPARWLDGRVPQSTRAFQLRQVCSAARGHLGKAPDADVKTFATAYDKLDAQCLSVPCHYCTRRIRFGMLSIPSAPVCTSNHCRHAHMIDSV